jgi:hypothetical protein
MSDVEKLLERLEQAEEEIYKIKQELKRLQAEEKDA